MKRGLAVILLCFILVISLSSVSAFSFRDFWNKLTGQAVGTEAGPAITATFNSNSNHSILSAIDGNLNTYYMACSNPSSTYNKGNIIYDLGNLKNLTSITLDFNQWNADYPGTAPCTYNVFVSADNVNWKQVYSRQEDSTHVCSPGNSFSRAPDVTIPLTDSVRYIKLDYTKINDGTGWCLALNEISIGGNISLITPTGNGSTTISCDTLYTLIRGSFNKNCTLSEYDPRADINKDGVINIYDFNSLIGNYNDESWCAARLADTTDVCLTTEEILLTSDSPVKTITVGDSSYMIELISASDNAATVKVTDSTGKSDSRGISEGSSKEINGIMVYIENADENNFQFRAILKLIPFINGCNLLSQYTIQNISYLQGIGKMVGIKEGQILHLNDYVVFPDTLLRIVRISRYPSEGTTGMGAQLNLVDYTTGLIYSTTFLSNTSTIAVGSLTVEGNTYTAYVEGKPNIDSSVYNITFDYPQTSTGIMTFENCINCRTSSSCIDSDGGLVPEIYGYTYSTLGSFEFKHPDVCVLVLGYDENEAPSGWQTTDSCSGKNCYVEEAFCRFTDDGCVDGDADQLISCSTGCSSGACGVICTTGCTYNGNCLPYTTRADNLYCDLHGDMIPQVADNNACQNNYECQSNSCAYGICETSTNRVVYQQAGFFRAVGCRILQIVSLGSYNYNNCMGSSEIAGK